MDTEPLAIAVDRGSPVPLYYQVAQQLEKAIGDGRLAPGTKLDNEIALAGRLRVSRPTMRRAIQELVDKGLLARRRGLGTQVVHDRLRRELGLTSLYDDLTETGQEPRTRVLVNRLDAQLLGHLGWSTGSSGHQPRWPSSCASSRNRAWCTWSGCAWSGPSRWR
jgi:GntR family transcriptional regulator